MFCAPPIGKGGLVSGYSNLLSAFSIGRVRLRNRDVSTPLCEIDLGIRIEVAEGSRKAVAAVIERRTANLSFGI